jgi:O-antigen ligase
MIIMFMAMNRIREEKEVKAFFIALLLSAFIVTAIGAFQFIGLDYFKLDFVSKLITPDYLQSQNGSIKAAFNEKTVFSTLYNPNYVGSYTAMLMPVIISALIYAKKNSIRIALAFLLCTNTVCWIGCNSRAGLIGGAISILVMIIMLRRKMLLHKRKTAGALVLLIAAIIAVNIVTGGTVSDKMSNMMSLTNKKNATDNTNNLRKSVEGINDLKLNSDRLSIETDRGNLQVVANGNRFSFADGNGDRVSIRLENAANANIIIIDDERFADMKFMINEQNGTMDLIYKDNKLFDFMLTTEGLKSNSNRWMTFRGNRTIDSTGFNGRETLGSGRGYIWSRTIPLLKETVFLGHGPDTFAIYFPQYDYIG